MLNIGICDNDILQIRQLTKYISEINYSTQIDVFTNGNEFFKTASNKKYHILFIEVSMNEANGLELVKKLYNKNKDAIVFFITSFPQYVSEAFSVGAFQYLLKPINKHLLIRELYRAINFNKKKYDRIIMTNNQRIVSVKINDIIYIEGYLKMIYVFTKKEQKALQSKGKLSYYEKKLLTYSFARVHQGYLVNMNYIKDIGKFDLICYTGHKVPISVRRRKHVKETFNIFIENKNAF